MEILYRIDTSYINFQNIVFFASIIIAFIILCCIFKNYLNNNHNTVLKNIFFRIILVFMFVIILLAGIFKVSENIYYAYIYNNGMYEIISGEVSNFNYIYMPNSNIISGVQFNIADKYFYIHSGYMNAGYKASGNIINKNGDHFIIYYIPSSNSDSIDTVLQISQPSEQIK